MNVKVLVVSLQGIGDLLLATPLFRQIKSNYPGAEITVLTMPANKELLSNNRDVDEIIFFNINKESPWRFIKTILRLRREKFDMSFAVFPTGVRAGFINFLAGAKKRLGHDLKVSRKFPWFFNVKVKVDGVKHVVELNSDLLRAVCPRALISDNLELTLNLSSSDRNFAAGFLKENKVEAGDVLVGVHLSASPVARRYRSWDPQSFIEAGNILTQKHKLKIVLIGAANEMRMFDEISSSAKFNPLNAVGKTSLGQMAALLTACRLLICNNSSPMHIAAALKVPTVSIFGPVDPRVYRPWTKEYIVIQKDMDCCPCYYNYFEDLLPETAARNNWHGNSFSCRRKDFLCLSAVTVGDVVREAEKLLGPKV